MKNSNTAFIIILIILGIFVLGTLGLSPIYGGHMTNWFFGSAFLWPMMFFMMIIWLLVVVALVLGIIWLIKQTQNTGSKNGKRR